MWTKEQKEAIDIQDKNILVSASAGSGKTAVLVERVINIVLKYKIDIDKILVVTFTNAAASELKDRLLTTLYQKIDEEPKNVFLKRQIKLLSRANIQTLDSFCIELVRSNFHILDIDPNFKICDNSKAAIIKNEVMTKLIEEKYVEADNMNKDELSLGLYKILELFGGKEEKLISSLYKIYLYIQSFPYPFLYLKNSIEKYNTKDLNIDLIDTDFGKQILDDVIDTLIVLLKRTKKLREKLEGIDEFKRHVELLDEDINILDRCIKNGKNSWDTLYELLHTSNFSKNLTVKVSDTLLKDEIRDYRANVLKKTFTLLQDRIYEKSEQILKDNKIAYTYLKYLYDFLVLFDSEFLAQKKELNLFEFNDIHHLALELLYIKDESGNYIKTEIANNLSTKYVEVYTDEYQDTDFVQEKILEAVSNLNNRFMVGDIKQSIYKFRQARPEIFNFKYDNYEMLDEKKDLTGDNVKIVLADNFRSRKQVLDSINYIFEQIMSKKMGECTYSDVETLKNGATWLKECKDVDYNTEINIIDINKEENKEVYDSSEDEVIKEIFELQNFEKEAIYIAKKIEELKENFKVYNVKEDKFEDVKYKDIVILTRTLKKKGTILENVLKKYQIPAFCDASTNLFLSDEIGIVMSFLKIIDNPLQDIYMVSVMYSIIGKFSLTQIGKIRLYGNNKNISMYDGMIIYKEYLESKENLDKESSILLKKINDFLGILDKFSNYSKVYKISELLIRMYKETNIYYQFTLEKLYESKKANLNLLIELAREYEKSTSNTLSSYISYIDNLAFLDAGNNEAKVLGENEDVVRIMSIHKSKGLEFPVVILADANLEYNERELNDVVILHQDLGIGINVVDDMLGVTYPSVIKQAIKSLSKKELRSEALRVLYVALTRAKEKLIIFSTVNNYEKYNGKQFILYNNDTIDPFIIENNKTYFSNINMALNKYKILDEKKDIFKINHIKIDLNDDNNIKEFLVKDIDTNINVEEKVKKLKAMYKEKKDFYLNVEKFTQKIEDVLEFKYPYLNDVNTASRVSVSSLKEEFIKKEEENEAIEHLIKEEGIQKYKMPEFLEEKKDKYTPVRKGTLVHFILENLDFKKVNTKQELKDYIDKLVEESIISKLDRKYINIQKIYNFLNSDIGIKLKKSNKIYKEEEFVLRNSKYSSSIIQGVIDLFFEDEEKKLLLVDFKTDKMENRQDYIKKYSIQLKIYKEAIETLFKRKVDKVYIYSFKLDDKIEVE